MKLWKPSPKVQRAVLALLILSLTAVTGVDAANVEPFNQLLEPRRPGQYPVLSVDDGDTLIVAVNGQPTRVRMIGVDTPELHHPEKPVQCFAHEARQFTQDTIGQHNVQLVADPLDDDKDLYGRLLRYVYLPDGTLVNAAIIQHGYGFAYRPFPFSKAETFTRLEHAAKTQQRGLWQQCEINEDQLIKETQPIEAT